MNKIVGYVYGLKDPNTGAIRYVGETALPLYKRWLGHLTKCTWKEGPLTNCPAWVHSLTKELKVPVIFLLEEIEQTGDPKADKKLRMGAERRWITQLQNEGAELLNRPMGARDPAAIAEQSRRAWARHTSDERGRRADMIAEGISPGSLRRRSDVLEFIRGHAQCRPSDIQANFGFAIGNIMQYLKRAGLITRTGQSHKSRWSAI